MRSPEDLTTAGGAGRITLKIVALYTIVSLAWILFSDRLLVFLVADPLLLTRLQTIKGWFFISVSAVCLYWLIQRGVVEINAAARDRWETESRFENLFQVAPVSIWELDLSAVKARLDAVVSNRIKGYRNYFAAHPQLVDELLSLVQVLDMNARTLALFAAANKAELLAGLDRILTAEARPVFCEALAALAEGKPVFDGEFPVLTLPGECRTIMVRLEFPADPGRFANLPLCLVDITERRRTEELLRLLESAVHHSRDAVVITTSDLELPGPKIVFVNPAFTDMTGYTEQEAIGNTPRMLHGLKTDRTVLEEMRQRLWQRLDFRGEIINYRKDGAEFINEWTVAPVMDRNFTVTHFVSVQRDITALRRSEAAGKENLAHLEAVFDRASLLIWLLQPDGTLIRINLTALEFIKTGREKLLGRPFWDTPWWSHAPQEQARLRSAVQSAAGGETIRYATPLRRRSGETWAVEFSLRPVRDEAGAVTLLVAEARELEEKG